MHYKLMYPSEFVAACDLHGKEAKMTILRVEIEKVIGSDGKSQQKPVIYFEKAQKRLVCCKTNAKSIAKMHGTDTDKWIGKAVTLYPTTCVAFGQEVECIRIK